MYQCERSSGEILEGVFVLGKGNRSSIYISPREGLKVEDLLNKKEQLFVLHRKLFGNQVKLSLQCMDDINRI